MHLYKLIKSNGDEEKIKNQLVVLENPEDQSSISTNIENIDNEDKKLNEGINIDNEEKKLNKEIKNFQATSPTKRKRI